jgi:hypothetical protein
MNSSLTHLPDYKQRQLNKGDHGYHREGGGSGEGDFVYQPGYSLLIQFVPGFW